MVAAEPSAPATGPSLVDLLTLERLEVDIFRAVAVYPDRYSLYGGQVAAQALRAAADTVDDDRSPHSLHGYFLSRGDADRPVLLEVRRDRDGRSYSNRRVVAVQDGRVIFNLAASFHVSEAGPDWTPHAMPDVAPPDDDTCRSVPTRLVGVETRIPPDDRPHVRWPARVWMRCTEPVDGVLHACVLTYLSDMFSGLGLAPAATSVENLTTLDHAVWFYRPVRVDDWVLMDLEPQSVAGGRGTYTGRIYGRGGTLVAGLAQESLFRPA